MNMLFLMAVSIIAIIVVVWFANREIRKERNYLRTLPTYEDAVKYVSEQYPDFATCFTVVQKQIGSNSGSFYAYSIPFYANFLECKEIGIAIRLRPENLE